MVKKVIALGVFVIMVQLNVYAEKYMKTATQYYLYVGAYTENDEEGILIYAFDATDGDLKYVTTEKGVQNPSYLAIDSKGICW